MATATLAHYNDGKGTSQSHEVYLKYPSEYEGLRYQGCGRGSTPEEALIAFRNGYAKAYMEAEALTTLLLDSDALPMIEVDCLGREKKLCQP